MKVAVKVKCEYRNGVDIYIIDIKKTPSQYSKMDSNQKLDLCEEVLNLVKYAYTELADGYEIKSIQTLFGPVVRL